MDIDIVNWNRKQKGAAAASYLVREDFCSILWSLVVSSGTHCRHFSLEFLAIQLVHSEVSSQQRNATIDSKRRKNFDLSFETSQWALGVIVYVRVFQIYLVSNLEYFPCENGSVIFIHKRQKTTRRSRCTNH